jgi:hypothetical protein
METVTEQSPHNQIHTERVEGTAVCEPGTGKKVGSIQRVMIDKLSGKVAYAVMTFGGFLGMGQRHYPVPWSALRYDPNFEAYVTDITAEQLRQALAPLLFEDEELDVERKRRHEERPEDGRLTAASCHLPRAACP